MAHRPWNRALRENPDSLGRSTKPGCLAVPRGSDPPAVVISWHVLPRWKRLLGPGLAQGD